MLDFFVSLGKNWDIPGFLAKNFKSYLGILSTILKILAKCCGIAKNNCQDLGKKCQKSIIFLGKKIKTPSTGFLALHFSVLTLKVAVQFHDPGHDNLSWTSTHFLCHPFFISAILDL